MSYAFDTLSRAWETLRQKLPPEEQDSMLATRFGFTLEELHEANHRLKDAVNHDGRVTEHARMLDRAMQMRNR